MCRWQEEADGRNRGGRKRFRKNNRVRKREKMSERRKRNRHRKGGRHNRNFFVSQKGEVNNSLSSYYY